MSSNAPLPAVPVVVASPEPRLSIVLDRADGIYGPGERAVFRFHAAHGGIPADDGEVSWTLSRDGVPPREKGTAVLRGGTAEITGTLDAPGFLRCEAVYRHAGQECSVAAGAAFEPFRIEPSLPAPDDFDAFWDGKLRALAAVPLDAQLTPPPRRAEGIDVDDVQVGCLGQPVHGFFARPTGAAPRSLPAIVTLHGAGVYDSDFDAAVGWARAGFLALDINAHGLPNGRGKDFYAHHNETTLKDYRLRGRESRETVYHVGMFLRVRRALDFLASRPEWDGRTLVCSGGSQGGAQALAGGGLDPRVTFVFAGVPAMCDHTGMAADRIAGWPKMVPIDADGKPDVAVLEAARYVDGVNFAARIRGEAFFTVGYSDPTCPPTGVLAAYNRIAGPKGIFLEVGCGHEMLPRVWDEAKRRVLAHAAR